MDCSSARPGPDPRHAALVDLESFVASEPKANFVAACPDVVDAEADACVEAVESAARRFAAAEMCLRDAQSVRDRAAEQLFRELADARWFDGAPDFPIVVDGLLVDRVKGKSNRAGLIVKRAHVVPLAPAAEGWPAWTDEVAVTTEKPAFPAIGDEVQFCAVPEGHEFILRSLDRESSGFDRYIKGRDGVSFLSDTRHTLPPSGMCHLPADELVIYAGGPSGD